MPAAVDVPVHAQSLVDLWLGEQLRQLRKRQRRSLADVAAVCGISLGLLSQVERGLSSPSLKVLQALAREYGVPVENLLRNAGPDKGDADGRIRRVGEHRRIDNPERGVYKEMYSPPASRNLELCRAVLAPGGSSGDELFATDAYEHVGVVVRGELELWLEQRVMLLKAGDSFCHAGNERRRWRNPGNIETEVIWAIGRPMPGETARWS
ncbi:MAG TPA: helix-turn-helix domain-containing protein [Bordetella sp.]